jgi:hypothetical protein
MERWNAQRTETQRQLAEKYSLENAVVRGNLLDASIMRVAFAALADSLTSVIMASALSRQEKEDLLRNLASWPTILDDVAQAQSPFAKAQAHQDKRRAGARLRARVPKSAAAEAVRKPKRVARGAQNRPEREPDTGALAQL